MTKRISLVLGAVTFLILVCLGIAFSQPTEPAKEEAVPAPQGTTVTEPQEITGPEVQSEPEIEWIWGEVVSANGTNNSIVVKYLDYETDQEKEITIEADNETTYENTKSILEIKPQDIVSVDYVVVNEKNIAKNISIEKEPEAELSAKEPAPETAIEDVSEGLQPGTTP